VLTLALDVTDKAAVNEAIKRGHEKFGRLDVVINNAGYGQFGAVEELSEQEARDQMETNLFGALWVTQAALPLMREQGSGHIIQVSSIGGVNAFTSVGIYHASKWALEGISQSLSLEVKDKGIHVTLVEPIGYTTDWVCRTASIIQAKSPCTSSKCKGVPTWKKMTSCASTINTDEINDRSKFSWLILGCFRVNLLRYEKNQSLAHHNSLMEPTCLVLHTLYENRVIDRHHRTGRLVSGRTSARQGLLRSRRGAPLFDFQHQPH